MEVLAGNVAPTRDHGQTKLMPEQGTQIVNLTANQLMEQKRERRVNASSQEETNKTAPHEPYTRLRKLYEKTSFTQHMPQYDKKEAVSENKPFTKIRLSVVVIDPPPK